MISEKEFEVINLIASDASSTQRELALQTKMSLGMVNILLKRLVTKGYLRIRQLNRKKVEYLLTPAGFKEKLQKTYHYTLKTLESLGTIRSEIKRLLEVKLSPEIKRILVIGEGDLADLAVLALQELAGPNRRIERFSVRPATSLSDVFIVDASIRWPTSSQKNTSGSLVLFESIANSSGIRPHGKAVLS